MIIGSTGHIDHGKTALVQALTGVNADRLPEEKVRGITLDLGYAYTDGGRLGFIDVPGHEKLVHNMLAGAAGIDFLLLAIAADDGPMPQTREHLAIASLLKLTRGAVALTKIDTVTPQRLAAVRGEISALLAPTALADAPLFPVCAPSGEGVPALHAHLREQADSINKRTSGGGFRLAIDRVFTLQGIGLVVTGTAFSGRVAVGDTLSVTPCGLRVRVRSLRVQNLPAQAGLAGQRIALNLAGDAGKSDLARGMWLVAPHLHLPVPRFQGEVRALEPLRHWQPVHVHLGAADVTGRLALLEGDRLDAGASALAEIIPDRPIGAIAHDRFILRDQSATRTLGGGMVLDIFPPSRHKRAAERLAALRLMALPDPRPALLDAATRCGDGVDLKRHALNRNLDAAPALWREAGLVVVEGDDAAIGFSAANWQRLAETALAALAGEHMRAPDMLGVERDRLRRLTCPTLPRIAFDRLLGELLEAGHLAQSAGWLHLPGHCAALAAADDTMWRGLRPLLDAAPFQPPRVRDVAKARNSPEDAVRALMKRVARVGLVYPVAHDHYFTAEAVAQLAAHVDALCATRGAARAAELRDLIGGGRKVAVHILEFLDRVGYTRRVRDEHVRREPGAGRQWIIQ